MAYLRPFGSDDIFTNRLRTHPEYEFTLYSGSQIINNHRYDGINIVTSSYVNTNTTSSFVNAFELNVDRSPASYYDYEGDGVFTGKSGELVRASFTPDSVWGPGTPAEGSPIATARASSSYYKITPILIKQNDGHRFRGMSLSEYNTLPPGAVITSSYPYTSSIDREYIPARIPPWRARNGMLSIDTPPGYGATYRGWGSVIDGGNNLGQAGVEVPDPLWTNPVANPDAGYQSTDTYFSQSKRIIALRNVIDSYKILSPVFEYSSSLTAAVGTSTGLHKPFLTGALSLISIPSIFYDSGIKKGTVKLEFYYTGSLLDVAIDERQNGELKSTMNDTSGSTVGVVLYNEGFIILTSTTPILADNNDVTDSYGGQLTLGGEGPPKQVKPNWTYFGSYNTSSELNDYPAYPSASIFKMSFRGTNNVPTMTMFANAPAGEFNNSNNPTWISSSYAAWRNEIHAGSGSYIEPREIAIKNTIKSDFCNFEDTFEKQVFISKVGIFDKQRNLIGIAKLANPVLKKEADSFTFKIKIDL